MGKDRLHRQEVKRVNAFEKQKKKVGKKVVRENLTQVSFSTRTIHMPKQAQMSTQHRSPETFPDLLSKVSHYNSSVRRDALNGLREVLIAHPHMVESASTLMALFERVLTPLTDPDPSVRAALLLLCQHLVQAVASGRLVPFTELLLAHTCRALTKINTSVQHDTLQFLDLWITCLPQTLAAHGDQLFQNLLGLISQESSQTEGARSLIVNPQSRLAQKKTRIDVMRRFLALAENLQAVAQSAATVSDEDEVVHDCTTPHAQPCLVYPSFMSEQPMASATTHTVLGQLGPLLSQGLLPIIFECWSEYVQTSSALMDATHSEEIAQMKVLADLTHVICTLLTETGDIEHRADDIAAQTTKHVLPHFPIAPQAKNAEQTRVFVSFDVRVCSLVSLLLPYVADHSAEALAGVLSEYLIGVFDALGESRADHTAGLYSLSTLTALLDSAKAAMQCPCDSDRLICSLFKLFSALPHDSVDKRLLVAFFQDLLVVDGLGLTADVKDGFDQWVLGLPKLLWELADSSPDTTECILDTLLFVGHRNMRSLSDQALYMDRIQSSSCFLFHAFAKKRHIFGPFLFLPMELQMRLALLWYNTEQLSESLLTAITHCIHIHSLDVNVVARILETLVCKFVVQQLPVTEDILGFLFNILVGFSSDDQDVFQSRASDAVHVLGLRLLDVSHVSLSDSKKRLLSTIPAALSDVSAVYARHLRLAELVRQALEQLRIEPTHFLDQMRALVAACLPVNTALAFASLLRRGSSAANLEAHQVATTLLSACILQATQTLDSSQLANSPPVLELIDSSLHDTTHFADVCAALTEHLAGCGTVQQFTTQLALWRGILLGSTTLPPSQAAATLPALRILKESSARFECESLVKLALVECTLRYGERFFPRW
eukprot:m.638001 g.638001  ORF g.638001 m.638001 type:complete len:889 (-) comp58325_c0_seq5:1461-4127(-)